MCIIRRHYIFKGIVQGVGFRYTCRRFATQLGLTGWVKNCYDGSVEMEVQGTKEQIQSLISYLNQDYYIRIDSARFEDIKTRNDETSFGIKGW